MAPQPLSRSDAGRSLLRRFVTTVGLLFLMTVLGAVGFRAITGARWLDCLYMAIITLTTVGYGEVIELGDPGRIFVIVYLILGIGTFSFSAFQIGQLIVSPELKSLLETRRMEKAISHLSKHCIVCGLGRMGVTICRHLQEHHRGFVVVDVDEDRVKSVCDRDGWLYVIGDATDDQVLLRAGIGRAQALAAVLPTDADNVYVTLSAHMLSGELEIIARASSEKAAAKMERAGASRVVSPFSAGALKMARFLLNPNLEGFLEIIEKEQDLELADVQVGANCPYVGERLMDIDMTEVGVVIVGLRRANGVRLLPPPPTAVIEPGDCLFAFGRAGALHKMLGTKTLET